MSSPFDPATPLASLLASSIPSNAVFFFYFSFFSPRRGSQAFRGYAQQAADGRRRQATISTLRRHRGMHHSSRTRRTE